MAKEYTAELQKLFLEMMLQDAQSFVRVQNIYNAENFDRSLREAAKFVESHSNQFKTLPTAEQVKAVTGVDLKHVPDLTEDHYDWFMKIRNFMTTNVESEKFSTRSIYDAATLLFNDFLNSLTPESL